MQGDFLDSTNKIAIIGMTGRFPGAKDIAEFWENILHGRETISFFTDEELRAAGVNPEHLQAPNYVKARAILDDIELFDAGFFNFNPREAAMLDPQHRIFLECAWAALEDAGYSQETYAGRIGLYAACDTNTYLLNNLLTKNELTSTADVLQMKMNDKDYLATRVSYKLNLKGPSMSVQTACSSSMVAVHLGCESLLSGESDMVLVGGISICVPQKSGYYYEPGGVVSPDGHCRAFDAKAQGTVYGDGVGVLLLKRLEDAHADGDHIYAVILSTAINNDGSAKVGFTAPSVSGQAAVIAEALSIADLGPEEITYIETHGTGTELGDSVEIAALTQAFRSKTSQKHYCAIGSLKTNIGHLSTSAGVASLIKTIMALKHKVIPPSLHYEKPNPRIDFANSPFYVNTTLCNWETEGIPRRAGVSSFGLGGTNAHVILEEAPQMEITESKTVNLLTLSAKSSLALEMVTDNLINYLEGNPDINLTDMAYTLQIGRQDFRWRRVLTVASRENALDVLKTRGQRFHTFYQELDNPAVAFMFTGLGDQYDDMAGDLYRNQPVFRQYADKCAKILQSSVGLDILSLLFSAEGEVKARRSSFTTEKPSLKDMIRSSQDDAQKMQNSLNQPSIGYPALFLVEYALAQLLISWGIKPQAMIGHSIGEYVAACLGGVFSLEDALMLVSKRGQMIEELPTGSMLAVMLPEEKIQPLLTSEISLATVNSPSTCVVAGSRSAIAELERSLLSKGIACQRVLTTHAFHSWMLEPILEPYFRLLQKVKLNPPQIPFVSNLTGTWITTEQAINPEYWVKHVRSTVRFADGIEQLWKEPSRILIEVGPGYTLSTLAVQHPASAGDLHRVIHTIRRQYDQQEDVRFLFEAIGKMWAIGIAVDWSAIYSEEKRQRIPLPTYPFERKRYWIDSHNSTVITTKSTKGKKDLNDWFYLPYWKKTIPPEFFRIGDHLTAKASWMILVNQNPIGLEIANQLRVDGHDIIIVESGKEFKQQDTNFYIIDSQSREDYDLLMHTLREIGKLPQKILHLWSITENQINTSIKNFEEFQLMGSYSVLNLIQSVERMGSIQPLEIIIVANGLNSITGEEELYAEKAPLLALSKTIPQEYPYIKCRTIDIALNKNIPHTLLVAQLLAEVNLQNCEELIAYRYHQRWVQDFQMLQFDDLQMQSTKLRKGGVYLITGGLGFIGQELAEYLARTVQAKLILVSTTASHLNQLEKDALIQKLHRFGAEVMVSALDISDFEQMKNLLRSIEQRFGAVNGIIHAAGTEDEDLFKFITTVTIADIQTHLKAKAHSLLIISDLLRDQELDFCLLCSSLSTILGGTGFLVYTAADQVLDLYAQAQNRICNYPWISLNWDAWQMREPQAESGLFNAELAQLTISSDEKDQILSRIMQTNIRDQIVVSVTDLKERIRERDLRIKRLHEHLPLDQGVLHKRPDLRNDYLPPRTETEGKMVEIWQQALGIEEIGVKDDFFELGGNSLLAVRVIFEIRQVFAVEITMANLVKEPTIEFMANYIDTVQWILDKPQPVSKDAQENLSDEVVWEEIEI